MKNTMLVVVAVVITAVMFLSFTVFQKTGSIKGTVTPADKAVMAWAISSTDTLNAKVQNGTFEFKEVKAGTYSIIIEAEDPYVSTRKRDVMVSAVDPVADVGEIKLQPK